MLAGQMSQQYDVFDPEEGVCRNAVVIIGNIIEYKYGYVLEGKANVVGVVWHFSLTSA